MAQGPAPYEYSLVAYDKRGNKLEGDGQITVHPSPLPVISKLEELVEYPSVASPRVAGWEWGTRLEGCVALGAAIEDEDCMQDHVKGPGGTFWTCEVDPETGIAYTWWFGEDSQK